MKVKTAQRKRLLRNQPEELPYENIIIRIIAYDFFDFVLNEKGKGLTHNYKRKKISNNTVVIDRATGLMWFWSGSAEGVGFEEAEEWVEILNQWGYADFGDWRLPTVEEAMSLMEPVEKNNEAHIDPIFCREPDCTMTADKVEGKTSKWVVDFYLGFCHDYLIEGSSVRPVRSI